VRPRRAISRTASLGIALLAAGCQPIAPETSTAPSRLTHVDSAAFGPFTGLDSLIVSDSTTGVKTSISKLKLLHSPTDAGGVIRGSALLAFVVDTGGHAVRGTVVVVGASRAAFARAACTAVAGSDFRPAVLDGRPRRAVAVMSFEANRGSTRGVEYPDSLSVRIRGMSSTDAARTLAALPGCP
jgi:hypothetical protein